MEEPLLVWHKQVRSKNVAVTGDLLKEQALAIAAQMGIVGFEKFNDRYGIRFKDLQGEAGAVHVSSLCKWQQRVLTEALAKFAADDIFNVDETGLFWQLLPNKTMAYKGLLSYIPFLGHFTIAYHAFKFNCAGGKKSMERITVLVGANMTETEKLPLLAIGKSTKLRSFKNKEVPVDYEANSKAWMTGTF